jgi:GNAT superfamily N-acetyltransferase
MTGKPPDGQASVPYPDLTVPGFPEITFRQYRGPQDFPAIVAVREACCEQDQVDTSSAREGIPSVTYLTHAYGTVVPGASDWIFVEVAAAVVGYAHVSWWIETGLLEVYLQRGWVVPRWRGCGIGRALLSWGEGRARQVHAACTSTHAATFAANCSSTQVDARLLLQRAGYRPIHVVSDMVCRTVDDLPASAPLPAGLAIAPVRVENARRVYEAYKDAWRGLWGETPENESDYRTFLGDTMPSPFFDPALWQAAWDGEEIAGFVIAEMDGEVGTFPEVAVRKRWQRRGVGTALMVRAMQLLWARGVRQMRLCTNADNPVGAKTVYERLGFREVKTHDFWRKPF